MRQLNLTIEDDTAERIDAVRGDRSFEAFAQEILTLHVRRIEAGRRLREAAEEGVASGIYEGSIEDLGRELEDTISNVDAGKPDA